MIEAKRRGLLIFMLVVLVAALLFALGTQGKTTPGRFTLPPEVCGIKLPAMKMLESLRGFDKSKDFVMERVLFGYPPNHPVVLIVRVRQGYKLVTVARFVAAPDKVVYLDSCATQNTDEFMAENAHYTDKIDQFTAETWEAGEQRPQEKGAKKHLVGL